MEKDEYKTIEVTKRVPVADRESLKVWMNQEMTRWLQENPDSGRDTVAGSKALSLIDEAGFKLMPPAVKR